CKGTQPGDQRRAYLARVPRQRTRSGGQPGWARCLRPAGPGPDLEIGELLVLDDPDAAHPGQQRQLRPQAAARRTQRSRIINSRSDLPRRVLHRLAGPEARLTTVSLAYRSATYVPRRVVTDKSRNCLHYAVTLLIGHRERRGVRHWLPGA